MSDFNLHDTPHPLLFGATMLAMCVTLGYACSSTPNAIPTPGLDKTFAWSQLGAQSSSPSPYVDYSTQGKLVAVINPTTGTPILDSNGKPVMKWVRTYTNAPTLQQQELSAQAKAQGMSSNQSTSNYVYDKSTNSFKQE